MLLHSRTLDSSQTPLVLRFSHSLPKAAFAFGFFLISSLGTKRATAENSSSATLNSNSWIFLLIISLNSGRCNSAFAGAAFGIAGTQNFGLSFGMTSHWATPGSPEGLGLNQSFLAVATSTALFFFFGPFGAELDAAPPLPTAIFSASSSRSFCLPFGLSIFQRSDGGRFDPLYVFTRQVPSQWCPSGMGFPVGVYLISWNISSSAGWSSLASASGTASDDLSIASSPVSACPSIWNSDWHGIGRGSAMTLSARRSGLGSLASFNARSGNTKLPSMSSTRRARCTVMLPLSAW